MRINGGLEFIFDGFTSGIPILLDEELTFGDKNSFDLKSFELYRENELAHENITNGSDTKFWINDNFTITKVTKQDEIGSQSLNEVLELSKWHGLIDLIDQTSLLSTNTSVYSERSFLKVQFDEEISEASFQLN